MHDMPDTALSRTARPDSAIERKGAIYSLSKAAHKPHTDNAEAPTEAPTEVPAQTSAKGPVEIGTHAHGAAEAWDIFFTYLARSANVEAALKASGLSAEQALQARASDPEMALRWQQSLAAGYDELEMDLLYRARFGTEKSIYYGGKFIETVREFDNGVALRLLGQHRKEHAERQSGAGPQENAVDVLRQRLLAYRQKLEKAAPASDAPPDTASDTTSGSASDTPSDTPPSLPAP